VITEVERKQLLQDIRALANSVPVSEQWRLRAVIHAVETILRYVSALETYSNSGRAGRQAPRRD